MDSYASIPVPLGFQQGSDHDLGSARRPLSSVGLNTLALNGIGTLEDRDAVNTWKRSYVIPLRAYKVDSLSGAYGRKGCRGIKVVQACFRATELSPFFCKSCYELSHR
jgi:hypothetical protein